MLPTLIVFVIVFIIFLWLDCRKPNLFPPGPKWLPIIGSALYVHKERMRTGMLWKAMISIATNYKHNGVVGFKVGKDKTVVAINPESIREMTLNEHLDGRPNGILYETRTWGSRLGVMLTDGELWMDQRRFVVRHLKEFGFARRGMVEMIQTEAQHMLADYRQIVGKQNGKALVSMQDAFNSYVLNTLWCMMTGTRHDKGNLKLKQLQSLLHTLIKNLDMMGALFSHFPLLRFVAPSYSGYKEFVEIHQTMHTFIENELENHKRNFKIENEPRDLMDVYLQVLQDPERKDSFSEKQLLAICLDMFIAGSETTVKTINFTLLYLIRNQDVQRKMQQEIDSVVGRERLPLLEDRTRMPYCEAVILEGLRIFLGNTFGLPHRALQDTVLCGYKIPKDSIVIACFAGMMMDSSIWPDPHVFRPERFLDQDNKINIPLQYNPFGAGKRRCMGEMMARSSLFLFVTTLLQNFNFLVPHGHPLPSDKPIDGATPSIQHYTALVMNRQ
ncbi:hypothetical protein HA402_001031 [Bradysia odoriphaga]|nr:hypothetical protein HA402_001031 [Bradysia odoriphaga]